MELIEDSIDLTSYMQENEAVLVRPASYYREQVIAHFHNPTFRDYLPRLPWRKVERIFKFRPGEVSIIAGMNGHGKTQLWSQVALGMLLKGERICVASLEMSPQHTMARFCRQMFGHAEPMIRDMNEFFPWTDGKLWLYDRRGVCKPDVMLGLIRYAKEKFDIDHFILDNLTKVIDGEDNFSEQKDFVNRLCALAADLGIHIHLIMHVRKGLSEDEPPNKMDIKGAGSVTDMVENVFIVWRNKPKERGMREGDRARSAEPDCSLELTKQRNADGEENEFSLGLWFDNGSQQYVEDRHAIAVNYWSVNELQKDHIASTVADGEDVQPGCDAGRSDNAIRPEERCGAVPCAGD